MTSAAAAAACDDEDAFGGRAAGDRGSPTRKVFKRSARLSQEDEYFNEDSEDVEPGNNGGGGNDDEDDALDAFMVSVTRDADAAVQESKAKDVERSTSGGRAAPVSFDIIDPIELKVPASTSTLANDADAEGAGEESDDEGRKREIVPLEEVDHSKMTYRAFKKNFYDEHPEVFAADFAENAAFMLEKDVSASGRDAPNPIREFAHCSFDDGIMKDLQRLQYMAPTGIQCCALPAALSGRDVLGLAATGSGKTASFSLPLIVHVKAAPPAPHGGGPTALILAPTRELAQQIYQEVKRLSKHSRLVVCVVFGGIGKYEQGLALKAGCDVLVATPGRLIDHVKDGCNSPPLTSTPHFGIKYILFQVLHWNASRLSCSTRRTGCWRWALSARLNPSSTPFALIARCFCFRRR